MQYREFQPRPESQSFLHCLWTLETDGGAVQRIVPDGRPEVIVNLGVPFESFHDGAWRPQPRAFLVGQITGPMLVRPAGPARIVAARFQPHGAARVFQTPIDTLTDDLLPVDLRAATVDELEALLLSRVQPGDPEIDSAVRRLLETPDLNGVAQSLGMSARHFERRFKCATGIAPKLFCRMQRFQRVFREIESGGNWVQAALACGYYDQAHLIRDIRQFSGLPPSVLSKDDEFARHFLSHFSKTARRARA